MSKPLTKEPQKSAVHQREKEIWSRIDRKLVRWKFSPLEKSFLEGLAQASLVVHLPDWDGVESVDPVEWVKSWCEQASGLADKLYETYLEVWKKQGETETADFVRAVCKRGVLPKIRRWTKLLEERAGQRFHSTNSTSGLRLFYHLPEEIKQPRSDFKRKMEIKAREVGHSQASLTGGGATVRTGIELRKQQSGAKGGADIMRRRIEIKILDGEGTTKPKDICMHLDEKKIPVPDRWVRAGATTFIAALKKIPNRYYKLVHDDRAANSSGSA